MFQISASHDLLLLGIVEQGRQNEIFYGKPPGLPKGVPYFGAPVEHARWILGSKKEVGPSLKVLDSRVF